MSPECLLLFLPVCIFSFLSFFVDVGSGQRYDPADFYTMVELVCSEGYSVQEYKIQTYDGYILTIHRIPNNKRRSKISRKKTHFQKLHLGYHPDFGNCVNESSYERGQGPPVLIAHGVFSASDNFVLQGSGYDLAYNLVDAGYDVWFSNTRGNFYSRKHVTLSPSDSKFWDFSFHENGYYDIPAIIDFILQSTGYEKINYVGHSMGTTMFFVMATTRPEYNDKINLYVGMTPLGQLKLEHFSQPKRGAFGAGFNIVKEIQKQGKHEIGARSTLPALLSRTFCAKESPFQNICYDLFFSFMGYHSKLFLRKKFTIYLCHAFGGSSVKAIIHYHQLFRAPKFQYFDYGPKENFRKYNQTEPLEYDLKKITVPVGLYYSLDDNVVAAKDVGILINELPNVVEVQPISKYSHVDYLWAYNAKDLVYNKILALMNRFRN